MSDLEITPSLTIPGTDLSWTAARASGSGGQNVNKVASKVDLRFDLEGSTALTAPVKARVRQLAGNRIDAQGRIVIVSQATRDQPKNLEDARQRLRALILTALPPPKRRRATKPSKASKRRRLDAKRQRSETKRGRGKIRSDG